MNREARRTRTCIPIKYLVSTVRIFRLRMRYRLDLGRHTWHKVATEINSVRFQK